MPKLVVIPSDPLEAYYKAGYDKNWLEDYYNPMHFFDEVYLLSPYEKRRKTELGMNIIPTKPEQLKIRLKELRIDVIRAYGGYWACDMACMNKVIGIPVIISVHDSRPSLLHDSINQADFVFCMSEVVKKLVLTKFNRTENAWILPNRVNFNVMRPFDKTQLKDLSTKFKSKFKILFLGRKSEEKNLDTLIKALRYLGDKYFLLAVGRGDQRKYIKIAKEECVIKQYHSIEYIPNKDLTQYYSWADCMCTPSRSEGFGIVFIEALACEAVVVTSDIAPMNEYIEHMKNGLLIKEYENPERVAEMIRLACNDNQIRESLQRNARKSVERFEKSKIDELEAHYYKKILNLEQERESGSI